VKGRVPVDVLGFNLSSHAHQDFIRSFFANIILTKKLQNQPASSEKLCKILLYEKAAHKM